MSKKAPKIFCVNWFRQDENGKFLWPGYGENLRVLDWILNRCEEKAQAKETPIGFIPQENDIDTAELNLSGPALEKLLSVSKSEWQEELGRQSDFLKTFGDDLPKEMSQEFDALRKRLEK